MGNSAVNSTSIVCRAGSYLFFALLTELAPAGLPEAAAAAADDPATLGFEALGEGAAEALAVVTEACDGLVGGACVPDAVGCEGVDEYSQSVRSCT